MLRSWALDSASPRSGFHRLDFLPHLCEFYLLVFNRFWQLLVPNLQHFHLLLRSSRAYRRSNRRNVSKKIEEIIFGRSLYTSRLTEDVRNAHDAPLCAKLRRRRALALSFTFLCRSANAFRQRRRCPDAICHSASRSSLRYPTQILVPPAKMRRRRNGVVLDKRVPVPLVSCRPRRAKPRAGELNAKETTSTQKDS